MEVETNLIVDCQVCQCTDTTSSVAVEKLGFETGLARCKAEGLKITTMVTDRSPSIKKFLRGEPDIKHQFHVWHYAKSIGSRMCSAGKPKTCALLLQRLPVINNHLWFCCRQCKGDAEFAQRNVELFVLPRMRYP